MKLSQAFHHILRRVQHLHASRHAIQKAPIRYCHAGAVQKSIAKSDEMILEIPESFAIANLTSVNGLQEIVTMLPFVCSSSTASPQCRARIPCILNDPFFDQSLPLGAVEIEVSGLLAQIHHRFN
jgi:hypothetical protein